MKQPRKFWVAAEIMLVFGFVLAHIWLFPEFLTPVVITVICAVLFSLRSLRLRRWPGRLGTKWDWSQGSAVATWVVVFLSVMIIIAFSINPDFWRAPRFFDKSFRYLISYAGWAMIQQALCQGYLTNRLRLILRKGWLVAIASGGLFGIAHYPNPVLMVGTLIFGAFTAYYFLKARNIFLLGLAHIVLGTAVKYLVASQLFHHSMRVGPGFWD